MSHTHRASTSAGYLLTYSNVASYGFLSMTGMLLITSSLPIAIAAFFLGSLVEGDVNKVNIMRGIKKSTQKDYLLMLLAKRKIAELLQSKNNADLPPFFTLYKEQLNYHNQLKAIHSHDPEYQQQLADAKQRLVDMRRYFIKMMDTQPADDIVKNPLLTNLCHYMNIDEFKSTFKHKLYCIRASSVVSFFAGIGTGFITAYATQSGVTTFLAAFGITAASTTMAVTVITLAIAAGIAYLYISFNNIHEMITDELVKKYGGKTKNFFTTIDRNHLFLDISKKILFALLALAVIGLGLFITAATAGTWWHGVKHGAQLISYLKDFSNLIRFVTVPFVAISALLFNFKNSLQTIWEVLEINIPKKISEIRHKIKETRQNEPDMEFYNPFRFIKLTLEIPLQFAIFIGHLIAVGAMTDRISTVHPAAVAAMGAITEGAEDLHYIMPAGTAHRCNHNHGGFISGFVKILFAFSGVSLLDALWRYAFSQKTFSESMNAAFGRQGHHHGHSHAALPRVPTMPANWKKQEMLLKIEDEQQRYQHAYGKKAKAKAQEMQTLHNHLEKAMVNNGPPEPDNTLTSFLSEHKLASIGNNRSMLFPRTTTRGAQFLARMEKQYSDLRLLPAVG